MEESQGGVRHGRRRRMGHRSGASFGGGLSHSSSSEGVGHVSDVADGDADLNDAVRAVATTPPVTLPPRPDAVVPQLAQSAGQEEYNPAARLAQVRGRGGDYEREYRLGLLHRMLMHNIPLDEISESLGVSVRQIQRDKQELKERLRQAAKELDIEAMIGESSGFYDEVRAMAMRAASNSQVPMPMRLAAMRTALASHNDRHRFYQAAGVFDVLRFRRGAGEGAISDMQRLMAMTDDLVAEARRERRPNDDALGGFSGGDDEVMGL